MDLGYKSLLHASVRAQTIILRKQIHFETISAKNKT